MGTTAQKLSYLGETKSQLKDVINYAGAGITIDAFRQYPRKLYTSYLDVLKDNGESLFSNLPHVTGQGSNITLNNTAETRMKIELNPSELSQDSTPSPSNPQDVHVITGDNSIKTEGKNLNSKGIRKGLYQVADGSYNANNNNYSTIGDLLPMDYGKTITFSTKNGSRGTWYLLEYDANKTYLSYQYFNNRISATFTIADQRTKYIAIDINNNVETAGDIQIEYGDVATNFTPYQSQTYPIYLGVENLINNIGTSGEHAGINYIVNADKSVSISGTASSNYSFYLMGSSGTYPLTLKPGTYTLSGGIDNNCWIRLDDGLTNTDNYGTPTTFTITEEKSYSVYLRVRNGTAITGTKTFYPMLKKGNKANSYTPYGTTPIEYCKIGDYSDKFFKNTIDDEEYNSTLELNKWYLKKNIGKVVLNGSESWDHYSIQQGDLFRTTRITDDTTDNTYTPYSNYFTGLANASSSQRANGNFYINAGNNTTDFIDNRFTSASNFKTWLSTHNTIVNYVLATPTYTLLNDTLQTQLDNLDYALSYNTQTNISQTNQDLPFNMNATAIRDISNILE